MKILLIIGPTGIGKTNLSIEYARNNNCPVIVLDRIQCYSEMSILSGRPSECEYKGTKRIYLTDLYIKDGKDIKKEVLMKRLLEILYDINSKQTSSNYSNGFDCIIEGGSITLLSEILPGLNINNSKYSSFGISSIIYLKPEASIENHKKYLLKIKKRVKEMCFPSNSDSDSMISEVKRILDSNQSNPSVVKNTLQYLVGDVAIDKVIDYIDFFNELDGSPIDNSSLKSINTTLINNISMGHYNYALSQIKLFDNLIKTLNSNTTLNINIKNIKI